MCRSIRSQSARKRQSRTTSARSSRSAKECRRSFSSYAILAETLGLALHRPLADQAARAIELAVAATDAEGRAGILDGLGSLEWQRGLRHKVRSSVVMGSYAMVVKSRPPAAAG